jgi:hypothetical protein
MPLISVPTKVRDRYLSYCLAARDADNWNTYKTAELKARVCSELIQDFWPDAWFLIIAAADEAVEENACCGIVFRTFDDFAKERP